MNDVVYLVFSAHGFVKATKSPPDRKRGEIVIKYHSRGAGK